MRHCITLQNILLAEPFSRKIENAQFTDQIFNTIGVYECSMQEDLRILYPY